MGMAMKGRYQSFFYNGKIYVRPLDRGIILMGSADKIDLTDALPEGHFNAKIVIELMEEENA